MMRILFTISALVCAAIFGWIAYTVYNALPAWALALGIIAYLPMATWVFYLAGMCLERVERDGTMTEMAAFISRRLLWPVAAAHNFLLNAIVMTVLFLDLPREPATTKRMNRYVDGPPGWRRDMALAIRAELLNAADPRGIHT